ncbi:MAG TPA: TOBE domain-containing protein [Candidatus Dormibacteraeota bacterium]|jgi:molybdopterin-binding protein|nr:TOBE domain-containing protein [Candidatus Dormibacteraeota bacterium]
MQRYRIGEAATLLGVSPDTARRLADAGKLGPVRGGKGERLIDGKALARYMATAQPSEQSPGAAAQSARNHFPGIVTGVVKDRVMAQVQIQAGPYRVVSLVSREAVEELGLEPGMRAIAVVKATNVSIEVPR